MRHTAWSNLAGWQLQRIVSAAEAHGLPAPIALQAQYSLLDRGIELEALPCALENGIGLTPVVAFGRRLADGQVCGRRAARGARRGWARTRIAAWRPTTRATPRAPHAILDVLHGVAARHGRPPSHVALAWLASRPGVASILLGARTADQLIHNLAAVDLALDAPDLDELTRASAIGLPPYPYGFLRDWSGARRLEPARDVTAASSAGSSRRSQ